MTRTQIQTQRLIFKGMISELTQEKQEQIKEMIERINGAHAINKAVQEDMAQIAFTLCSYDVALEGMEA